MKRTSFDILQDLAEFVRALPLVKPEDIAIGDLFVNLHHGGYDGATCFKVVSKTATLLRYDYCEREYIAPTSVKPMILTFKSMAKKKSGLRRASPEQARKAVEFNKAVTMAEEHAKDFVKRSRDVHVVWNHASEVIEPEARSTYYYQRTGFVLEVFDGNGSLKERVRMLTDGNDGDDLNQHYEYDVIERMVKVYAALNFDRDAVRNGAKFQITYAPQID